MTFSEWACLKHGFTPKQLGLPHQVLNGTSGTGKLSIGEPLPEVEPRRMPWPKDHGRVQPHDVLRRRG
jgi:hypothetical protein